MPEETRQESSRRQRSAGTGGRGKSKTGKADGERREGSNGEEQNQGILSRVISVATGMIEQKDNAPGPTDMLREDHDKVRALFKEYEDLGERASAEKKRLVSEITRELEVHAAIEEKIFYQAFRDVQEKDPRKVVRESFEEHKIVKTLLAELGRMQPSEEQYDAKVTVLQESVEHHADEEERDLFPAAEKLFDEVKLDELARRMAELKQQMMGGRRRRETA